MIRRVRISRRAEKQLTKLPLHIVVKLMTWVRSVELEGLEETRKVRGFHDELLSGARSGQRSVRLNRSYRVIYMIRSSVTEFVSVEEITRHKY